MAADDLPGTELPASSVGIAVDRSPLLDLPGAVAATGRDAGIAWHYGDPVGEQRAAVRSAALFDRSHRSVLTVTGADRLRWLHTLTTQAVDDLPDGAGTQALVLSPTGHVEHAFAVTDLAGTTFLDTEPDRGASLLAYLGSMVFWSDVRPERTDLAMLELAGPTAADILTAADLPVPPTGGVALSTGFVRRAGLPPGAVPTFEIVCARDELGPLALRLTGAGARPAGSWAHDALRIEARRPRIGVDTDDRSIPNELPWLDTAVHLAKGCYRGQETVARVHNLGRPPRRLVLLHLDGSVDTLPEPGDDVQTAQGRTVGRVGTVAHHHENGPIALALVKRTVQPGVPLLAGGVDAAVDPDDAVVDGPGSGPPRSVIDRSSLPDLRRPGRG